MLGPIGQRVHVLSRHWLGVRVHITFFTNLAGETYPFAASAIYENNTGETFRDAVFDALDNGVLVDGDYFIIDGAAVHFAADTFDEINNRLRAAGVRVLYFSIRFNKYYIRNLTFDSNIFVLGDAALSAGVFSRGLHFFFFVNAALLTFSFQLNPCELCFQIVKAYLRKNVDGVNDFLEAITRAFAVNVTVQKMERFYVHCVLRAGQSAK